MSDQHTQGSAVSDEQIYVCMTTLPCELDKATCSSVDQLIDQSDEQEYLLNVHHMSIENFMILPCVIQYVFRETILPTQINANI